MKLGASHAPRAPGSRAPGNGSPQDRRGFALGNSRNTPGSPRGRAAPPQAAGWGSQQPPAAVGGASSRPRQTLSRRREPGRPAAAWPRQRGGAASGGRRASFDRGCGCGRANAGHWGGCRHLGTARTSRCLRGGSGVPLRWLRLQNPRWRATKGLCHLCARAVSPLGCDAQGACDWVPGRVAEVQGARRALRAGVQLGALRSPGLELCRAPRVPLIPGAAAAG